MISVRRWELVLRRPGRAPHRRRFFKWFNASGEGLIFLEAYENDGLPYSCDIVDLWTGHTDSYGNHAAVRKSREEFDG